MGVWERRVMREGCRWAAPHRDGVGPWSSAGASAAPTSIGDRIELPQRGRNFAARADPELPVNAREMHLNGLDRQIQRLTDLAVRHAVGRQSSHTYLARRERITVLEVSGAQPFARSPQLVERAPSEWVRAEALC